MCGVYHLASSMERGALCYTCDIIISLYDSTSWNVNTPTPCVTGPKLWESLGTASPPKGYKGTTKQLKRDLFIHLNGQCLLNLFSCTKLPIHFGLKDSPAWLILCLVNELGCVRYTGETMLMMLAECHPTPGRLRQNAKFRRYNCWSYPAKSYKWLLLPLGWFYIYRSSLEAVLTVVLAN